MQKELKEKLLKTNYFKDNEWLDQYINLVTTNKVKPSVFKTQTHHILPKTYYKKVNLPIDNSNNNLVELLFKDHVYAHWLLLHCTTGFLYRNSGYTIRYMLSKLNINKYQKELSKEDLNQLQFFYENSIININKNDFINYYLKNSCKDTAKYFNIGLNTVTRLAIEYNCLKCKKRHEAKARTFISKKSLFDYYITQQHSLKETAEYFKVDKSTIIRRLKDLSLNQTKNKFRHDKRIDYSKTPSNITEFLDYCKEHSNKDASIKFNLSISTVKKILKDNNINKLKNFNKDEINQYYIKFGYKDTMQRFNISKTHLYRIINTFK